jgi:phosphoribosylanthranilate isomerase
MLVQIYGITHADDAAAVDALGADTIGLALNEGFGNWDGVNRDRVRTIRSAITKARVVGLSLATELGAISATMATLEPDVVHLARAHLMSSAELTRLRERLEKPLMLTVPIAGPDVLPTAQRLSGIADYLLLDTAHPTNGVVGATGMTHDWDLSAAIVRSAHIPVILAGGLGPDNVVRAIEQVQPDGVDSETHTSRRDDLTRKDLEAVELFITRARAAAQRWP